MGAVLKFENVRGLLIGEAAGEKLNVDWNGPADCSIGSSVMLKVSKLKPR